MASGEFRKHKYLPSCKCMTYDQHLTKFGAGKEKIYKIQDLSS